MPIEISNVGTGKVGDAGVIAKSAVNISVGCSGLEHQGRVRSAKLSGFQFDLGGGSPWSRAGRNNGFARAGPEPDMVTNAILGFFGEENLPALCKLKASSFHLVQAFCFNTVGQKN